MTPHEPQVTPTSRYTRSEAGKLLGVSYDTIVRWVRLGLIQEHYRNNGGVMRAQPYILGKDIHKRWYIDQ